MASFPGDIKQCLLRSRNYKYRDVNIPNQVAVVIGRGPQTKIRDRRCSKNQVQIIADFSRTKAIVTQLGANPSEVQDKLLFAEEVIEVDDGSSINLLEGNFKYTLEFSNESKIRDKNKHDLNVSPNTMSKRLKTSDECSKTSLNEFSPVSDSNHNNDVECLRDGVGGSTEESSSKSDCKEVLNNFKALSTEDSWEEYDHSKILIFTSKGLQAQGKAAAFDLDYTIICTQSGRVFPTSTDDWKIMYAEIPGRLKRLHFEGFKIVIFTNQKGISRGRTSVSDFKTKVQRIVQKLGIPIQVLVSTGSGKYRKPNTGMWDYFVQKCNKGLPVQVESSLYVGDAAGRLDNWAPKKKKDFSCADRLFALNVGLKFSTPEEFFLNQKPASYKMPVFDPRNLKDQTLGKKVLPPPVEEVHADSIASSSPEVIVFVGFPAAGKSHFAQMYLIPKGYKHVNRDTLGSWQKCVSECSKALRNSQKVVIDNTNPDIESRSRYIVVAKEFKIPCRCFLFTCSLEQAKHNNVFRELQTPDEKHVGVNDMVLNGYKSKYKEPSLKEGFTSIVHVNFVPKFKSKHEEKLFRRFLIEK